ncbi:glycosyltransferase family 2 protein [Desulfonatronum lacustre]|uniref:glycosyltransferase family 2 protein n=1 Tax=Desulfonatronum lacustre TaxID=66849 RepID=UPI0004AF0B16|nr:glycosyltransferase family 2 protein [Desulfonatronum lacustre]
MKIIFILSMFFIFYTYIIYPFILLIRSKLFPKPINKQYCDILPMVSIVIAARNEEKNIEKRINNLLELDYPSARFEIVVVSDGSDDNTNQIVRECAARSALVRIFVCAPSRGKASALSKGVREAQGEIIVFADCRQWFDRRVVMELVANFNDPQIGCVSGELVFVEQRASTIQKEMGVYWRYEKMVRKLESQGGSVVGATGAIYAIRRELYKDIPAETILDDVLLPMIIVMQGQRCVFDPSAVAYDTVSKDMRSEMTRKIRTLAGNWQLLKIAPELMSPLQDSIWWCFLSHKIFRLLVPFWMLSVFFANFFLAGLFFTITLVAQLVFYGVAVAAYLKPEFRELRPVSLIYFFVNLNYAVLLGTWCFFSGNTAKTWRKVA